MKELVLKVVKFESDDIMTASCETYDLMLEYKALTDSLDNPDRLAELENIIQSSGLFDFETSNSGNVIIEKAHPEHRITVPFQQ